MVSLGKICGMFSKIFGLSANFIMEYNNFDKDGLLKFMIVCKCSFYTMVLVKSATVLIYKCPLYLQIE